MIRPFKMNILAVGMPMIGVEAQPPQIHFGSMHETMIEIMATRRYIMDS